MTQQYDHPKYGPLKLGRAPRAFGHVTPLSAVRAMRAVPLPPLPVTLHQARSPDIAFMFGNNEYGDCTCAGMGNAIELVTADAQGAAVAITDADVLSAYADITGFNPGPPPINDNGAVEQDVLRWWQQVGLPLADGTRSLAGPVFELNPKNVAGICEVIQEFGFCYLGISIPSGFMETLPPVWYDDPSFGPIEGGHCVLLTGFDRTDPTNVVFDVTTWGTNQEFRMRQDFLLRYCDEAYAVFLPPWIEASGKTPFGFDEAGLAEIGGEVGTDLTSVTAAHVDHGALEAARLGFARSSHWPTVEREVRAAYPYCLACAGDVATGIQVHHVNPFHYVVALGRPDLELDPRNLICLCETEAGDPSPNHHLRIGHLGNFKLGNLEARDDAIGRFHGMTQAQIEADPNWQSEEKNGRLKALDEMTADEKRAFRARLDADLPPDPAVMSRFGLTVPPYAGT